MNGFKQAISSKDNPYRDFYIWKDGKMVSHQQIGNQNLVVHAWEYDETNGAILFTFV